MPKGENSYWAPADRVEELENEIRMVEEESEEEIRRLREQVDNGLRREAELKVEIAQLSADKAELKLRVQREIRELEETVAWKVINELGGILTRKGQWLRRGLKLD